MNTSDTIDRLCARHGIAIAYTDGLGVAHQVPAATKRALLAAMGVVLTDAGAGATADTDRQSSRALLEPVLVWRVSDGPVRIRLSVPAALAERELAWNITREDGEQQHATLVPAHLPRVAPTDNADADYACYEFTLPSPLPEGYHSFSLYIHDVGVTNGTDNGSRMALIVAPPRCYQPVLIDERRTWGIALQLYAVRSSRNWGIGDFGDLMTATEYAAACGADLIGVNPLHALFPANPSHTCPYSPSSRLFLNLLYLDIEAIVEYQDCAELRTAHADAAFQARLRGLRNAERVQYVEVAEAKLTVLETLYNRFVEQHLDHATERAREMRAFCVERGKSLRDQTRFDALHEHFRQTGGARGWTDWPADYHDPDAEAVNVFAARHAARVDFFAYLYWLADQQLSAVANRARDKGLGVGLYQDLALGSDRNGAEVWSDQTLFAVDADLGAPPDDFNRRGQNWGLPPLLPTRLRAAGYAPFRALLRQTMRHAGAVRIDHVLALARQFWIPRGAAPEAGSYVDYPLQDLLGIVALESQRNQCLVIGEDLGTVPDGLRDTLKVAGILTYSVLWFEQDAGGTFKRPENYAQRTLVTISTHDLPTLSGFWQGHDLDLRASLHLFPDEDVRQAEIVRRVQDRTRLLMALEQAALLPADNSVFPAATLELTPELAAAIHLYLSRTPAAIMMVRPEDVFGQLPQPNLPGATGDYPNWQYKLPLNLDEWLADKRLANLVDALRRERGVPLSAPDAAREAPPRPGRRIPRATYRLQFNHAFTFAQATALVPYLADLGISHCYASPCLQARPGSLHGYDIVDHRALNREIGTRDDFEHFVATLHAHGMGLIMDTVPNHMAIMGSDNGWWLDVLENGRASAYAEYFDIDWDTYQPDTGHKIVVPVLGDHYAKVLDNGELRLSCDAARGEFSINYFDHRFPIDPREYPRILGYRSEQLATLLPVDDPNRLEYESLITAFGHLPPRTATDTAQIAERARDKELHKRRFAALCAASPDIANLVADNVADINRQRTDQAGTERLHELINAQAYRLAFWRVASDEINYRRFFDINDLAALRMENDTVLEATHALIFDFIERGMIDGLRIDHPDGLYDPAAYFARLQHRFSVSPVTVSAAQINVQNTARPIYVVVEKILAEGEHLPEDWQVHGTTGYDFANLVNGLFVKTAAAERLRRIYNTFIGEPTDYEAIVYRSKMLIVRGALAAEFNVLANQLSRIAQSDRYSRDYTLNSVRRALAELVACFPVYRTYVTATGISDTDMRYIARAVVLAKKRSLAADVSVFDFLQGVISTRISEGRNQGYRDAVTNLVGKLQQYTAPVMAKGLEDTSFYIYNRLTSLNEVGGDPRRFGITLTEFHHANEARGRHWPHAMLATSTHDSKRSEDVRARINVLSELPGEWRRSVSGWRRFNRHAKHRLDDQDVPSHNDEYLFYQTLLGVWPGDQSDDSDRETLRRRIGDYLLKAVREAKIQSSWLNPNQEYETSVAHFVETVLAVGNRRFLDDFNAFSMRISWFGMLNSLAQVILKLTAPGVPDIYQGNEIWDFSLVDPDNRRPVDYRHRQSLLASLAAGSGESIDMLLHGMLATPEDGTIKLWLTWRTLQQRRESVALFRDGEYLPLRGAGERAEHLCAFARRHHEEIAIVVVPRLTCTLLDGVPGWPTGENIWVDTAIELPFPNSDWQNVYNRAGVSTRSGAFGTQIAVADLFIDFPFALLRPTTAAVR